MEMSTEDIRPLPQDLLAVIQRSEEDNRPVVFMTCGIAGSGKSTLAKTIVRELPQFTRVSIDEIVYAKHGLYGKDYPADHKLYDQYLDEAGEIYLKNFHALLDEKKDVVLDRSFWAKADRDEFKKMIEDRGGRRVLVYLRAGDKEALWKRICDRSAKERNANSAYDISREIYDRYWAGWQAPEGEGEIIIDVFPQRDLSSSQQSLPPDQP